MTIGEYEDLLLRWLVAKRDWPGLDVGPEPKSIDLNPDELMDIVRSPARLMQALGFSREAEEARERIIRDFNRSV